MFKRGRKCFKFSLSLSLSSDGMWAERLTLRQKYFHAAFHINMECQSAGFKLPFCCMQVFLSQLSVVMDF